MLKQNATKFLDSICRCSKTECPFGGNCIDDSTIRDLQSLRDAYWGAESCDAPSNATRRVFSMEMLRNAYNPVTKKFQFIASNKEKNNRLICEAAYLIGIGLSNHPTASKAPQQWRKCRKFILEGKDLMKNFRYSNKSSSAPETKNKVKFLHCETFIRHYAKNLGETVPTKEGDILILFIGIFI